MNGILPLWKERGMTSHDCVIRARRILKTKKVGHTGTLDPDVDGVLPLCIGKATKVAEYVTDQGKTYEAEVTIGFSTETEDASGAIVERDSSDKTISRSELLAVLKSLTGEIVQVPPMYSAVKVNGRKLYEYARKGETVERPARTVRIDEISLLDSSESWSGETITFPIRISCGKGTYIRTLAVQIGEALGYPAHMSRLTRTESGNFSENDCITLAEAEQLAQNGTIDAALKPLKEGLIQFPFAEIAESDLFAVRNGQVLPAHVLLKEHPLIVLTWQQQPVAVYKQHPEKQGKMKPEKMFGLPENE